MNLGFETVKFTKVSDVVIPDTFFNRLETPVEALNAIFGTGILQGSTIIKLYDPTTPSYLLLIFFFTFIIVLLYSSLEI